MSKPQFDVIVIGGGPAGSTASTLLAKKGYKVALLEKETHPRPMVGESILPHFWKYTDLLGVSEEIEKAGFINKSGGIICWDHVIRGMKFTDFGYLKSALHVERDQFDQILFKNAQKHGVDTFENARVTEVSFRDEEYSVNYTQSEKKTLTSKFIIDSTGQSTLLSSQFGLKKYDKGFRFQAFWSYFNSMDYLSEIDKISSFEKRREEKPKTLVSHLGNWGWIWQIILQDKVSVGVILERESMSTFKSKGADLKERFLNALKDSELISKLMRSDSHLIEDIQSVKDYSYYADDYCVDNALLTGDASAFVDPINSAGIIMAFFTGFFASWTIDRALKNPNKKESFFNMYNDVLKTRFKLFRSIAVPEKEIDEKELLDTKSALKSLSKSEIDLMITQISLTQRANNLSAFLLNHNLDHKPMVEELSLEKFMQITDKH